MSKSGSMDIACSKVLRLINLEKLKEISRPENCTVSLLGSVPRTCGGVLSAGPPVGPTGDAQEITPEKSRISSR
ncbi:MAG: hypothetical protein WD094_02395 [Balneolaceae bacterium]